MVCYELLLEFEPSDSVWLYVGAEIDSHQPWVDPLNYGEVNITFSQSIH
jgi:hypothetical protein